MKVLFLDFDGVLNSHKFITHQANHTNQSIVSMRDPKTMIDPEAVKILNKIIEATGAKVVISSSWRHLHEWEELQEMLIARGFEGEVIGQTPDAAVSGPDRGHEIQEWLDAHLDVESFVIIDDSSDMAHLMDKLVSTSFYTGLLESHIEPAIKHLNG